MDSSLMHRSLGPVVVGKKPLVSCFAPTLLIDLRRYKTTHAR